jgi:hypothetical protein
MLISVDAEQRESWLYLDDNVFLLFNVFRHLCHMMHKNKHILTKQGALKN